MNEIPYAVFLEKNPTPRRLISHRGITGHPASVYIQKEGRTLINFSSSDYLGLATHPLLISRSQDYTKQFGAGASASRLVTGNFFLYEKLEATLADLLGKPAALILGSGYQTNMSVLDSLLNEKIWGEKPLIFCDKQCHSSLIQAVRFLSFHRFRHNDLSHLAEYLEKYRHTTQPKFIIVESIYSMDGDEANLRRLTELAKEHQAFLYVDDAHAVGVYGPLGFGKAAEHASDIAFVMGTFSKALGGFGSYLGCSKVVRDYLINTCKGFIYSTGLPPAVLGAISAALEIVPTLNDLRKKLEEKSKILRQFFCENQLNSGQSTTHIIPWIIGDADDTVRVAHLLEEAGILAVAIRPPSVAINQSRIRFCLSALHGEKEMACLMKAIMTIKNKRFPLKK